MEELSASLAAQQSAHVEALTVAHELKATLAESEAALSVRTVIICLDLIVSGSRSHPAVTPSSHTAQQQSDSALPHAPRAGGARAPRRPSTGANPGPARMRPQATHAHLEQVSAAHQRASAALAERERELQRVHAEQQALVQAAAQAQVRERWGVGGRGEGAAAGAHGAAGAGEGTGGWAERRKESVPCS